MSDVHEAAHTVVSGEDANLDRRIWNLLRQLQMTTIAHDEAYPRPYTTTEFAPRRRYSTVLGYDQSEVLFGLPAIVRRMIVQRSQEGAVRVYGVADLRGSTNSFVPYPYRAGMDTSYITKITPPPLDSSAPALQRDEEYSVGSSGLALVRFLLGSSSNPLIPARVEPFVLSLNGRRASVHVGHDGSMWPDLPDGSNPLGAIQVNVMLDTTTERFVHPPFDIEVFMHDGRAQVGETQGRMSRILAWALGDQHKPV